MRISDWSSDVCSSDLLDRAARDEHADKFVLLGLESARKILALHAGVRRTSDMHVIQERGKGCLRRDQRAVVEKCRIAAIFGLQSSRMRFLHRNLLLLSPFAHLARLISYRTPIMFGRRLYVHED